MKLEHFAQRWGVSNRVVYNWVADGHIKIKKKRGLKRRWQIKNLEEADSFVVNRYRWFRLGHAFKYRVGNFILPRGSVAAGDVEMIDEIIEDYDGEKWIRTTGKWVDREIPVEEFEKGIMEKRYSIVDRKTLLVLISKSLRNEGLEEKAKTLENLEV